jgi:hypothetical protein
MASAINVFECPLGINPPQTSMYYYFHPKAKLLYLLMAIGNAAVLCWYTDAKDIGHLFL